MNKEKIDSNKKTKNDEIDLIQLVIKIWGYRKFILIFTGIVVLVGVIYSLLATKFYESKVTLYQIKKDQSTSSNITALASQFGFGGFAAYLEAAFVMHSVTPEGMDSQSDNWFYVQGGVRIPIGL